MSHQLPPLPCPDISPYLGDGEDCRTIDDNYWNADSVRAYAELAIASMKREPQWLPIESAPQNSDEILVLSTNGRRSVQTGLFACSMTDTAINNGEQPLYTHWTNLPPPIKDSLTTDSGEDVNG